MCKLKDYYKGYSRVQFHTDEIDVLQLPYLSMNVKNSVTQIYEGKNLMLPHIDFEQVYISDLAVILASFKKTELFEFVRDALHTTILEAASYTKNLASLNDRRKWRKSIETSRKITPLRTASLLYTQTSPSEIVKVRTILYVPSMEALPG